MSKLTKKVRELWFRPIRREQGMSHIEEISRRVFANIPQERQEREQLSAKLVMIEVGLKNMARR